MSFYYSSELENKINIDKILMSSNIKIINELNKNELIVIKLIQKNKNILEATVACNSEYSKNIFFKKCKNLTLVWSNKLVNIKDYHFISLEYNNLNEDESNKYILSIDIEI
jgi:hypothetical protein